MTKRDYKLLAQVLSDTHRHNAVNDDYREGWHAALTAVALRLAEVLAADNERFDKDRFVDAAS